MMSENDKELKKIKKEIKDISEKKTTKEDVLQTHKRIDFYCAKCALYFDVDGKTLLDEIKCPKCKTFEIFIELSQFEGDKKENTNSYFT